MLPGEFHQFGVGCWALTVVETPSSVASLEREELDSVDGILVHKECGVTEAERADAVGEVFERRINGRNSAVGEGSLDRLDMHSDDQASACRAEVCHVDVEGCVPPTGLVDCRARDHGEVVLVSSHEGERRRLGVVEVQSAQRECRLSVRRVGATIQLDAERL